MELYIKVENGETVDHPALKENLLQAFGLIPENWEPFVRVQPPPAGVYEIVSDVSEYKKVKGVWTDVWSVRAMTNEEKIAKQQMVKDAWANRPQASNWAAWVFNENTCDYEPPIPRPEPVDEKIIFWSGADNNWKETPPYPEDGKRYDFDFFAWIWVEITG